MDSIYKTKRGSYVDLSKIVSMHLDNENDLAIQFQLVEKPTEYALSCEELNGYEELVNAWKEYNQPKKVTPIQLTDIIDPEALSALQRIGESLEDKPRKSFQERLEEEMAKKKR